MIHRLLELVAVQQDYAWFCTLMGWLGVAALAVLRGRELRASPVALGWLGLTLAGGVGIAGVELGMHAWLPGGRGQERVMLEGTLNALLTLQGLGVVICLMRPTARRRVEVGLVAAGLAGLWWVRREAPEPLAAASGAILLMLGLAAGREMRRGGAMGMSGRFAGAALVLVGVAHLLSTTGYFSELWHQQRRWTEVSLMGLLSAGAQLALAIATAGVLEPRRLLRSVRSVDVEVLRRELKTYGGLLLGWLVVGVIAAWVTGWKARASYEDGLVARARAASVVIDVADVRRVLGPEFGLVLPEVMIQPSGRSNALARAPWLLQSHRPVSDALARVELVNPSIYWAHLMSPRDGYLVSSVFSSRLKLQRDSVALHRWLTSEDQRRWENREAYFEGPMLGAWGELVRAAAPIVDPESGMLAWVALDFGVHEWVAVQALARLQTFALVGAGVGIWLLLLVRRLREHGHRMMRAEALQAQAAERAKTTFLAKVSHELRTPVQSILGYGDLLDGIVSEPRARRWTGAIRTQSQLLIRLVNDLIDLSAMQSGAFRMVPRPDRLVPLLGAVTESLQPRARAKGLELLFESDGSVPEWLSFDPDRIRQVMLNLVGNAIKFTDQGEVSVRVRAERAVADRCIPVVIEVRDTGPGIAAEDQERIFRPFSRLEGGEAIEGVGLGLALAKALCESMAGSLRVESDGVRGSCFIVEAPLTLAREPETRPGEIETCDLRGLRVLVADDNTLVRELFVTGLREAGAWCETVVDGLEAIDRCSTASFDVVVIDVSMPWLDGLEVAKRLRAGGVARPRIVGVSGDALTGGRRAVETGTMDAFLVKPVQISRLVAAVAAERAGAVRRTSVSDNDLRLLRRLRTMFAGEALRMATELRQASDAHDRGWLRSRVHYLKNSADTAGYAELGLLCEQVSRLIEANGPEAGARIDDFVGQICRRLVSFGSQGPNPFPDSPGDSSPLHHN